MHKDTNKTDAKKIQINNKNSEFSDNLVVGTKVGINEYTNIWVIIHI